jgi:hypothetical protein
MRTPWAQIAEEIAQQHAPQVGTLTERKELTASERRRAAVGGIVNFIFWAVGRCPKNRPPSSSAIIVGDMAAELIAAGADYEGDPQRLVAAYCEVGLLDRIAGGFRVKGLDRYDRLWAKNYPEAAAEWRIAGNRHQTGAEPALNRAEKPPSDPDQEKEKDDETKNEDAEEKPQPPTEVEDSLWDSIQWRREHDDPSRRLAPEKKRPRDFRDWVQRALADGFTQRELERAHCAYLLDEDFRHKGWPTAIFITEGIWRHRARIPTKLRAL